MRVQVALQIIVIMNKNDYNGKWYMKINGNLEIVKMARESLIMDKNYTTGIEGLSTEVAMINSWKHLARRNTP